MSFVLSFPILGSSRILASCFQVPGSEEIPTFPLPLICQTELIHRMNCLKQEFRVHRDSIEVKSIYTFLLLQDPTILCTGTFEHRMTTFLESLYHFVGCAIPLSFLIVRFALPSLSSDPGPRNVPCPGKFFRVILDFLCVEDAFLITCFPKNVIEH